MCSEGQGGSACQSWSLHAHPAASLQVDLASMHVQCSIRGICSVNPSLDSSAHLTCIAPQPGTGHLVLASAAATLQLYDPTR